MPEFKSDKKEELKKLFLSKIYNMNNLFAGCSSLQYLPNISKWKKKYNRYKFNVCRMYIFNLFT